jgi:hypothetical protein
MKKLCLTLLAMAATAMVALPVAHADTFNWGTVTFTVWTGTYSSGVTDIATLPAGSTLPATPTATFTYTGLLNFVNNNPDGGSNTWANFLTSNGINPTYDTTDITGFSSSSETEAAFLGSTMSTLGETGSAVNSYVEITGTYNVGPETLVTLKSDDGSSLYIDPAGPLSPYLISMPGPQDLESTTAALTSGSHTFDLVYVESNGSPAVLQMSATPEPSSLLLLGTGLLGLAFVAFRKAKSPGAVLGM